MSRRRSHKCQASKKCAQEHSSILKKSCTRGETTGRASWLRVVYSNVNNFLHLIVAIDHSRLLLQLVMVLMRRLVVVVMVVVVLLLLLSERIVVVRPKTNGKRMGGWRLVLRRLAVILVLMLEGQVQVTLGVCLIVTQRDLVVLEAGGGHRGVHHFGRGIHDARRILHEGPRNRWLQLVQLLLLQQLFAFNVDVALI